MRNPIDEIDEAKMRLIIPGTLLSIGLLFNNTGKHGLHNGAGMVISSIVLGAHCAELLLKYKLQREGKDVYKDHELYDLFELLDENSKNEIRAEFRVLSSQYPKLPKPIWSEVDIVFKEMNKASMTFRYAVEGVQYQTESTSGSKHGSPFYIFLAAMSIANTTSVLEPLDLVDIKKDVENDIIHTIGKLPD